MTENQLTRRYEILEKVCGDKRNDYSIKLHNSLVDIRNIKTLEGIYTDCLQKAKRWIVKNLNE